MIEARTFPEWRERARPLLLRSTKQGAELRLSRQLMKLLECISHYRHDGRWELMYRLAWRTLTENPRLLEDCADRDVRNARLMEKSVERECHKMHAFVRFRESRLEDGSLSYFAWFEPEHEVLRRAAGFFTRRFPNMRWTIATPDEAAVWNRQELRFIDAPAATERSRSDSTESLWRSYYRSVCNVARINPQAMRREMPQRYWRNLPETAEIHGLVRAGESFLARADAAVGDSLKFVDAAQHALSHLPPPEQGPAACRRCALWKRATQAVVGEGPSQAAVMLIGEQPGDKEDLIGRPFIGPAGKLLDESITEAGMTRSELFVTNAVKHFKWEPRGKRRLHTRPEVSEVSACHVWLDREISSVRPRVIVGMGATAMRSLCGRPVSIESARGQALDHLSGAQIVATYHPAAILRAAADRARELRAYLIADLRFAASLAGQAGPANVATAEGPLAASEA